jgi:hypothetical protein
VSLDPTIRPNKAYIVIHVENRSQALRNATIAFEAGAHGIFLISHGGLDTQSLLRIYIAVHNEFPTSWIGINFLGLSAWQATSTAHGPINGLWVDDLGIKENLPDPLTEARILKQYRAACPNWQAEFFGSVAFKGQAPIKDLSRIASLAAPLVDVVTTSGPETGTAPGIDKIRIMREAIGNEKPLAIASGITPENVTNFLPFADTFLVATGVSDSFTELNSGRVRMLVEAISLK